MNTTTTAIFACLLLTATATAPAGAAPGLQTGFLNDTTTASGQQTVAAQWHWSWERQSSAILLSDAGPLQITWEEVYDGGERVSAHVEILFVGTLGSVDCTIDIDDRAGTGSASGSIRFGHATTRPCSFAEAGIGAGPEGLCGAMGDVYGKTDTAIHAWGSGLGACAV